MDVLVNELLTLVLEGGYPVVGVAVLVSSIGLPLPAALILLISGSVVAVEGLNPVPLFLFVTGCSVAGDSVDYFLGRKLGSLIVDRPGRRFSWLKKAGTTLQQSFVRWSGLSVFLTRWLFTPFSSAVSLFAGVSRYPFHRFLLFALAGEAISSALFLGLGYAFGVNGRYLWNYFDGLPGIIASGVAGVLLVGIGTRRLLHRRQSDPATQPTLEESSHPRRTDHVLF